MHGDRFHLDILPQAAVWFDYHFCERTVDSYVVKSALLSGEKKSPTVYFEPQISGFAYFTS